jgi:hypothetical protein
VPALIAALGCAPVPRPSVLADVDRVRQGAAALEAKTYAPGGYAHAEKLRREADAAFEDGDTAGAHLLGERALAAYAHAAVLARIARAETSARQSTSAVSKSTAELSTIEADQARVAAEAEALELRLKAAQDAQVGSGAADPEREKARVAAARSLSLQARLLCGAARMLLAGGSPGETGAPPSPASPPSSPSRSAPKAPSSASPLAPPSPASLAVQLEEAMAAVTKLDGDLASGGPAPIDQASRSRAGCLAVLTAVRRAATPISKAPGAGDALLAALSAAGTWSPSRDDRGVTVTLRGLFKGDALTPAAASRLAELGRIAAAHPTFPVVIVLHQDKELAKKDERASLGRAELIVKALKAERATRVEGVLAGAVAPVVDPEGPDRARNARVEVVFVTPETF